MIKTRELFQQVKNYSDKKEIKDSRFSDLSSKGILRNKFFNLFKSLKKYKIIVYLQYMILKKVKFFKNKIKLKKYFM